MSELYHLTLSEAREKLLDREISASELTAACLGRIERSEPEIRACLTVMAEQAVQTAAELDRRGPDPERPLWGLPLGLKDLYCTKGVRTTAASRMLENYVPAYDAHVVSKLKEAGAVLMCKTNLDEFAMGSSTEFSAFGLTRNPWDQSKIPGGSSGGAAASVAAYQTPGGLGTDTGGSIRQPAALCGCVGLKPTYGRVSRYGILAFASSLDQAGPLARRVRDVAWLLKVMAGPDDRDNTCSTRPAEDYPSAAPGKLKGLRLGLPQELWEARLDPDVAEVVKKAFAALEAAGAVLIPMAMPNLRYSVAAYYILATAEASTNLARFDGLRYGRRSEKPRDLTELYTASRSEALGPEVQRRILLGTFALSAGYYDAYYQQAARVRRLIRDDYFQALDRCDFLLAPVSSLPAWDFGRFAHDPVTVYQLDLMTLPVNLAGLPALSLPAGLGPRSGLPVGLQLIGRPFDEMNLLGAGLAFEEAFPPLL
ncbi:MAG: Asp-tRNA(Asn)/Glu-tRNA(Gln) amidotransferase subunit GatA [Candidatus Adiutrix sp.]|jgi:aspartyl-tRNA(Asn)/glutamyl-tRNA(Gln) amidotransferase subunit A|nr:Asp-tRNA(Asn)/Glu-tRNA(Gln) amidotransferase subunit GatA [Candidatus Adiutrix sp.]